MKQHLDSCLLMARNGGKGPCRCDDVIPSLGVTGFEFMALARYNSECAWGLVHTPEYDAKMQELRRRYKGVGA